jgi:GT2 family glycosyltransferase
LISVIIVNWNGINFIQKCLDGLRAQTCRDFSIVMVDNASQDGSLEIVQKNYSEVKILAQSENIGFSAANNIATKSVNTDSEKQNGNRRLYLEPV